MNLFWKIFFGFWAVWILWYLTGGPMRDSTSKKYVKFQDGQIQNVDSPRQ